MDAGFAEQLQQLQQEARERQQAAEHRAAGYFGGAVVLGAAAWFSLTGVLRTAAGIMSGGFGVAAGMRAFAHICASSCICVHAIQGASTTRARSTATWWTEWIVPAEAWRVLRRK